MIGLKADFYKGLLILNTNNQLSLVMAGNVILTYGSIRMNQAMLSVK